MTIYEQYSKEICSNCKNRKECKEELRRKVDGSIKCEKHERNTKNNILEEQIEKHNFIP